MSEIPKKLETVSELECAMSSLKEGFPLAKQMWQVMKDVRDRKLEANLYTDQWPDFTTVISQEFTPRLSEIADIRIYTTEKERIMPLLEGAKLLENIGTWQLIHYLVKSEDSEALLSYLLDSLRHHPNTKGKTSSLIFDYSLFHSPEYDPRIPYHPTPPEFYVKPIPPETAEYVAKHWIPATVDYPLEHRIRFLKDTIACFDLLGVYKVGGHDYPVSWLGVKTGGVIGIGFSFKKYRQQKLNLILTKEICERCMDRGDEMLSEKHFDDPSKTGLVQIGESQIIAIY